jgi:hypothetical protein
MKLLRGGGHLSAVSVCTRSLAALLTDFFFGVAGLFIYVVSLASIFKSESHGVYAGGLQCDHRWARGSCMGEMRLISHRLSGEARVDYLLCSTRAPSLLSPRRSVNSVWRMPHAPT